MPFFTNLRERIASKMSSPPRNRKYEASLQSSSLKQRLDRRSMSPTSKTRQWLTNGSVGHDTGTTNLRMVQGGRVIKHRKTTAKTTASTRRPDNRLWLFRLFSSPPADEETDNEGSDSPIPTPIHPAGSRRGYNEPVDPVSRPETTEVIIDPTNTAVEAEQTLEEIANGDWTAAELALFNRLNNRGFEPLLPANWAMDFQTVPHTLFSHDESEILIKAASDNEFRGRFKAVFAHVYPVTNSCLLPATNALTSLVMLGVRVRERLDRKLTPEPILRKEIESYIKWSIEDGGLKRRTFIPILSVVSRRGRETVADIVARTTRQMHENGRRYRELWYVGPEDEGNGEDKTTTPLLKGKGKGKSATPAAKPKAESTAPDSKAKGQEKGKSKSADPTPHQQGILTLGSHRPTPPESLPETEVVVPVAVPALHPPAAAEAAVPTPTSTPTPTPTPSPEAQPPAAAAIHPVNPTHYRRPLPTIYGIVIYNTVASFVTYDARHPGKPIRTISLCNFADEGQDVWNAFAVSILVIVVRDWVMALEASRKASSEVRGGDDPDA
ncbi:hypothetical protein MMC24_000167 [Lignoscripta atroalba]|nr:hypothetical protein [Lignoscripta atroalba]